MTRASIAGLVTALLLAGCGRDEGPDLILHNAKIFTASNDPQWAEAVALVGDRIVEVGASEAILRSAGPRTRVIDAEGRVMVPGFNDAHYHAASFRIDRQLIQFGAEPPDPSLDEVLDSLRSVAARTPTATWLWVPVGGMVFADPRTDRSALDAVAPDHPVALQGWAGHGRVLNTTAEKQLEPLVAAKWAGSPPDVEGVRRDGVQHGYDGIRVDGALQRSVDSVMIADLAQAQAAALG